MCAVRKVTNLKNGTTDPSVNLNDVYKTLCPQQMLVHKGGQINNVQLITGLRIAEMSQLQNCSVMCTKNGSYCENEKREKKSVGRGDVYKELKLLQTGKKSQGGGGQGRSERRSEAFVKIIILFFCGGDGRVGLGGSGWM